MKKILLLQICGFALLVACTEQHSTPDMNQGMMGSDKDSHGCIGSAGYEWCERSGKCERPWELAKQEGFANDQNAFTEYCSK